MSAPFAKLFDTPSGQLLLFKCESDDEDPALKVMAAPVGDISPSAILSYDTEAKRDLAFDRIGQDGAERFSTQLRAAAAGFAGS